MTQSSRDDREFAELVIRCLDGLGGPEDLRALEEQLRSDAEKVSLYNELCLQVQDLEDTTDLDWPVTESGDMKGSSPATTLKHGRKALSRAQGWAAAAALALVILAAASLVWFQEGRNVAQRPTPTVSDAFVATLADVGDDVVWSEDHALPRRSEEGLGKGWIRLDAGTIEVAFRSGATVRLEGPAMFGIDSCLRGSLEFGSIEVHAPESASDFTVNTPAMDVVDLGTRYALCVNENSGQADVSVSEGRVDLHLGNAGRRTGIYSLAEGQSATVSAIGGILKTTGRAIEGDSDAVGLLAHWSFNSNDGQLGDGDLVEDTSPNALHGRILQFRGSEKNEVRTVPGVDSSALDLSNHGAIDLSERLDALGALSSFTISAWVRDPKNMIFSISNATDRQRIQFERSGSHLYYGWQNDQQWDAVRAVPHGGWHRDRWHHVVVTVDDRNVTLYHDGRALIGPCSTGILLGTPVQRPIDLVQKSCAFIGKADRSRPANVRNRGWKPEQFFDGEIDDVQVYDRALDEEAVRYLHSHPGEPLPTKARPAS